MRVANVVIIFRAPLRTALHRTYALDTLAVVRGTTDVMDSHDRGATLHRLTGR
jgi:hypothetical protein